MKSFISFISLLLLSNASSAQFGAPVIIDSNYSAQIRNIIAVDIDNDGLKDIVASHQTDTIKWYKNFGNNTFSAPVVLTSTIAKPFLLTPVMQIMIRKQTCWWLIIIVIIRK